MKSKTKIAYNMNRLMKVMSEPTASLLTGSFWQGSGDKIIRSTIKDKEYVYIDRGSNILAIAHLDTVADGTRYSNFPAGSKYQRAYRNPTHRPVGIRDTEIVGHQLDDRLGVYLIGDLLPSIGINVDVLLTTNEECGQSTASYFATEKKYNWMFQFDRHGFGTCVMYQYETPDYNKMLTSIGYDVQIGTFSDICRLGHLGITGFNFGCGYINEHTDQCMTRLSWVTASLQLFVDFFFKYENLPMPYVNVEKKYYPNKISYSYSYGGMDGNERCVKCHTMLFHQFEDDMEKKVCSSCLKRDKYNMTPKELVQSTHPPTCIHCGRDLYALYGDDMDRCRCTSCIIKSAKEQQEYGICALCNTPLPDDESDHVLCYECREFHNL